METINYKELPYDTESEQAVLGSLLIDNKCLDEIGDFLQEEHFYIPIHSIIYKTIVKTINKGSLANPITIKSSLSNAIDIKNMGGAKYLVELASNADKMLNIKHYAKIIYNLSINRKLISIGKQIVQDNYEKISDAEGQIEKAEKLLFNIAEQRNNNKCQTISDTVIKTIDIVDKAIKRDGINCISTGYTDVDSLLGGLKNSDLLILAARPSMGKTALATCIAYRAAIKLKKENQEKNEDRNICIFSLEMSSEQLTGRILSVATGINSHKMFRGTISNEDFSNIINEGQNISEIPLLIDDTPAISITELRAKARRLKRQNNISLIIVDYLQLLRGEGKHLEGNRVQEVSEITRGLKIIAKELDIPVLALSQLSRAVEQREDKRPQLSDLRESGSIEQDADIVMFLYREEYYLERKKPDFNSDKLHAWQADMERVRNVADLIIAKHRNGAIGRVLLHFNHDTTCFSDFDNQHKDIDF